MYKLSSANLRDGTLEKGGFVKASEAFKICKRLRCNKSFMTCNASPLGSHRAHATHRACIELLQSHDPAGDCSQSKLVKCFDRGGFSQICSQRENFKQTSHEFQPTKSQHACLKEIKRKFQETNWFLVGDLSKIKDFIGKKHQGRRRKPYGLANYFSNEPTGHFSEFSLSKAKKSKEKQTFSNRIYNGSPERKQSLDRIGDFSQSKLTWMKQPISAPPNIYRCNTRANSNRQLFSEIFFVPARCKSVRTCTFGLDLDKFVAHLRQKICQSVKSNLLKQPSELQKKIDFFSQSDSLLCAFSHQKVANATEQSCFWNNRLLKQMIEPRRSGYIAEISQQSSAKPLYRKRTIFLLKQAYLKKKKFLKKKPIFSKASLQYVRFSNSFLIGLTGYFSKRLACRVNRLVKRFIEMKFHLRLNKDAILLFKSGKQRIPFLGYLIDKVASANKISGYFSNKPGGYFSKRRLLQQMTCMALQFKTSQWFRRKGALKEKNFTKFLIKKSKKRLLKRSHSKIRLLVNMPKVIESLADKGFCDRSGNPKPNFHYFQHSQNQTVSRVAAILRGVTNYYQLAESKRRCLSRCSYILTHSIAMMFAAKFKLGTRAKVFALAGRNLTNPLLSKKRKKPFASH
uniref:Putative reverse transcriptase/maturase n=1 Tax=Gonatozygon brebissonii TaxID=184482 RepID=A0A6G9IG56_9VIRI|nr:putative reverse transcriptase/maturase [Gonatozygon brebissonii]QIQ23051.1 putative reverse transcriptase/maturase [Gonatozygon brebissonii]